jgi:hypothetical protein
MSQMPVDVHSQNSSKYARVEYYFRSESILIKTYIYIYVYITFLRELQSKIIDVSLCKIQLNF